MITAGMLMQDQRRRAQNDHRKQAFARPRGIREGINIFRCASQISGRRTIDEAYEGRCCLTVNEYVTLQAYAIYPKKKAFPQVECPWMFMHSTRQQATANGTACCQ
eukprot:1094526-Pelagomonas_calceolata.AAC.2